MSNSNMNRPKKNKNQSLCKKSCDTVGDVVDDWVVNPVDRYVSRPVDRYIVEPVGNLWDNYSNTIVLVILAGLLYYWLSGASNSSIGETFDSGVDMVKEGAANIGQAVSGALQGTQTISAQAPPNFGAAPTPAEIKALFNF
jgi:hypothetical protein